MASRFLFVYQTLASGGVEAVIRDRMEVMLANGVEAYALFLKDRGGLPLFQPFTDRVRICPERQDALKYVADLQPDWVIHFDTPDLVSEIAAAFPKTQQIYEVHTTLPHGLKQLQRSDSLSHVRSVIVPSQSQLTLVRSIIGNIRPLFVVPNGLPEIFFSADTIEKKPTAPVVIWIGRLEAHKNWQAFIKIAAQAARVHPEVQYWLIGGRHAIPEQHHMLWSQLKSLDLVSRLRWFPEIPRLQLPDLTRLAARSGGCLISTSRAESFGLVVLEAMAGGCPVIVPRLDALLELVRDGRQGLTYPAGDWDQAANSLIRLLSDRSLQQKMGKEARECAAQFTARACVDRFLTVIEDLERTRHD